MSPVAVSYGAAEGYALDQKTGFGIYNARIVLTQSNVQLFTGYTDANGFYDIENVPVGTYVIWCIATNYTQQQGSITINPNSVTTLDFQMPPVGTAVGFHMEVEFDPSSPWGPYAAKWYAEVDGMVAEFLPVDVSNPNSIWNGPWDLTTRSWPATLTVQLYDSSDTLLVTRVATVTMQNGHAYSFYIETDQLVDLGTF
jgi:hypothetical protein